MSNCRLFTIVRLTPEPLDPSLRQDQNSIDAALFFDLQPLRAHQQMIVLGYPLSEPISGSSPAGRPSKTNVPLAVASA